VPTGLTQTYGFEKQKNAYHQHWVHPKFLKWPSQLAMS